MSFIGRFFLFCPKFGGSFIGGSTVDSFDLSLLICETGESRHQACQALSCCDTSTPGFITHSHAVIFITMEKARILVEIYFHVI